MTLQFESAEISFVAWISSCIVMLKVPRTDLGVRGTHVSKSRDVHFILNGGYESVEMSIHHISSTDFSISIRITKQDF